MLRKVCLCNEPELMSNKELSRSSCVKKSMPLGSLVFLMNKSILPLSVFFFTLIDICFKHSR